MRCFGDRAGGRGIGIGHGNKIDDAGCLEAFQVPQVVGAEAVDTYQRHLGCRSTARSGRRFACRRCLGRRALRSGCRSIPAGLGPGVCGGWCSHGAPFGPGGLFFPARGLRWASAFQIQV
jgi:hypothetical protein